jgi:hypothetical protein
MEIGFQITPAVMFILKQFMLISIDENMPLQRND